MLEHLLDAVLDRHTAPGESEAEVLARIRRADSRLTDLYRRRDVMALDAYADPLIRAAYLLRYLPHYTLQIGDLLRALEGDAQVAAIFSQPRLQHMAFGGGPAPEAIALAVLHQQGGGTHLHTKVLDQRANQWSDCWPISCRLAMAYSEHPGVEISGLQGDLSRPPAATESALLAGARVLSLMNVLNELMAPGAAPLRTALAQRLGALPSGALVLISDQAFYERCVEGMQLVKDLLSELGARILISRTVPQEAVAWANRFELSPRLRQVYGQSAGASGPATRNYRIRIHSLQLAALMP
jgi:hypothetical protein